MEGFNGRGIFDKIRKWYGELSGASKFVIMLSIILFVSNVIVNIWSCKTFQNVEQTVNNIISDDTNEFLKCFGYIEILEKMKEYISYLIFVLISIFAYYISLYIGKFLGFFKSIAEFLGDIKEDPFLVKALIIYDIIGIFFDIYSIYSLITV